MIRGEKIDYKSPRIIGGFRGDLQAYLIENEKRYNLKSGLATYIAEMLGAQIFNEREGNEITKIYGAVTNGTNWHFLELESQTVIIYLDEYYLNNSPKLLGILSSFVGY